jgi:hypothetical protein
MTDYANSDRWNGPKDGSGDDVDELTVESYETDGGVVFYDADNPLAWVEAARPVRLDELA